ncbi:ribokinase [Chondrinema litorale]|uniref:ribokinase n=1 Tax=Chondrinema litorale TaxID=2994555 RepID=UPI002543629A|nr:ribokinase [Chondrinema litorale]UZR98339.1 ribokinase [Chondrinema litorale]
MEKKKIIVVGSSNTDMVVQSDKLPAPGETVMGNEFIMNPGGKGANQAVAAAKLAGEVIFISKVGEDVFGEELIKGFENYGLNTKYIFKDEQNASGIALILVDSKGENSISIAPGANKALTADQIDKAISEFEDAEYLLMQLEIPLDTVNYTANLAANNNVKIILNPAPAQQLPDSLLKKLYIITPNETEAQLLTGIEVKDEPSAHNAAKALREKGVDIVIITLGAKGAYFLSETHHKLVSPPKVSVVDTTAAGDTFNGALTVALAEGRNLIDAIHFANKAAALSVTKMGAQNAIPTREELLKAF